jgi:hypothetical protein
MTVDNAYRATGKKPYEDYDFIAYPGDKTTWAPKWGFVTTTKDPDESVNGDAGVFPRGNSPMFRFGGSFGGWKYGAAAYGGDPDDNDNVGPDVNDFSSFAGVFGTGVFVTGVAGTSTNGVGVYGQTGNDSTPVPQEWSPAGVLGVGDPGPGVVGWSMQSHAVVGWSYEGYGVLGGSGISHGMWGTSSENCGVYGVSTNYVGVNGIAGFSGPTPPIGDAIAGVFGSSDTHNGVIGTSTQGIGVYGYSTNYGGIVGATNNTALVGGAGTFFGNVGIAGNLTVTGTKSAVVPFPDGSRRALYCMESPELWFEDFGSAKLARGRAVVKLDANFAKVIKRGDYRVFVTPEGNCHGLYVRRKSANNFEVRELMGGKSSIAFSYRIVGRRKDIKQQRRFPKIDMPLPPPTDESRPPRKLQPTAAGLRAFVARVEKEARERAPKGAEKARAHMRRLRARALRG